MKRFYIIIFLLSLITICSCTALGPHYTCTYKGEKFKTYSIFRPYIGVSDYRNGYWDNWERDGSLRAIVDGFGSTTTIVYYKKHNHPGDYEFKIDFKEYIGLEGEWEKYKGTITVKKSAESELRNYYRNPKKGVEALKDYWIFDCVIKRTSDKLPEEKFIFPKLDNALKYVYNIYYNGVARAFDISGVWVGADQYDGW